MATEGKFPGCCCNKLEIREATIATEWSAFMQPNLPVPFGTEYSGRLFRRITMTETVLLTNDSRTFTTGYMGPVHDSLNLGLWTYNTSAQAWQDAFDALPPFMTLSSAQSDTEHIDTFNDGIDDRFERRYTCSMELLQSQLCTEEMFSELRAGLDVFDWDSIADRHTALIPNPNQPTQFTDLNFLPNSDTRGPYAVQRSCGVFTHPTDGSPSQRIQWREVVNFADRVAGYNNDSQPGRFQVVLGYVQVRNSPSICAATFGAPAIGGFFGSRCQQDCIIVQNFGGIFGCDTISGTAVIQINDRLGIKLIPYNAPTVCNFCP